MANRDTAKLSPPFLIQAYRPGQRTVWFANSAVDDVDEAKRIGQSVKRQIAKIDGITKGDDVLAKSLPKLASALAMHNAWLALQAVAERARQNGLKLPAELSRALLIWPRDSQAAWDAFLSFESKHRDQLGSTIAEALTGPDLAA